MTIAYRVGHNNELIDFDTLLVEKPKYKFDKFQEYYDAIHFLFDPYYSLTKDVKKELARITLVALDQMGKTDRENLLKVGIRDKKAVALDDILQKTLQLALSP